ncbi:MAG: methyltransferase domain-containing protein [Acidobacteria bacterium]|nr:methyltransferase domain-containing protein [Acidobacteriota bacterium]MCA1608608.1 methyltransferase domain-containing protein [Acidobacteriota bacterium]
MFDKRSTELERIDIGDYTPEEYAIFLRETAFINRYFGDGRALKKTLLAEIDANELREFSVLDVGCGSGELLRMIAEFAKRTGRKARLIGLDLNPISSTTTQNWSQRFSEIESIQGDALSLPFADDSFDHAISSLFFHHLTDASIVAVLKEMSRIARRGIFVIDLHRDPVAYVGYKIFCVAFRISPLVRQDGSLSIKKGFRVDELKQHGAEAGLDECEADHISPGRIVLRGN